MALRLSVCICLSQVGVLPKQLNESSWILEPDLAGGRPVAQLNKSWA